MHRIFYGLSRLMAILGGIVLAALIVLVCVSIIGRTANTVLHAAVSSGVLPGISNWLLSLGIGPVNGDFELVEAGIAFSIFAFIPYCTITAGHASVDIFTNWLPDRVQRILKMLIEILFAVVMVVIARQLFSGMESKMRSGQTTFLLQFPVWWAYALSLTGAVVAALVGVYMAVVRISEAFTGQTIIADDMGAEH